MRGDQDSTQGPRQHAAAAGTFRYWNQVAVDASGLDHTPPAAGEDRRFGEQLGPGRSSRAMAIVHIAMADAVSAVVGGYRSYTGIRSGPGTASLDAAIAQAAHDTLVVVFPSPRPRLDGLLAEDLARIAGPRLYRLQGIVVGQRAAAAIVAMRARDRSQGADPQMGSEWITSDEPGHWRQDPVSQAPIAMGAKWGEVRPFVIRAGNQFRAPPPPAMTSEAYTRAFEEVKALGGDGATPTQRSLDQA